MSNSTETQRKPIGDRLGGENSLPIRLVRESLWETDNPFIKLCRTYPGQIVIAVITYYLFKQVLGAWLMNVLIWNTGGRFSVLIVAHFRALPCRHGCDSLAS